MSRADKRIKFFLMVSDTLYQDEFMFDTLLNLLDHSTMFLILIIFRHPVKGTILQSPLFCSCSNTAIFANFSLPTVSILDA